LLALYFSEGDLFSYYNSFSDNYLETSISGIIFEFTDFSFDLTDTSLFEFCFTDFYETAFSDLTDGSFSDNYSGKTTLSDLTDNYLDFADISDSLEDSGICDKFSGANFSSSTYSTFSPLSKYNI